METMRRRLIGFGLVTMLGCGGHAVSEDERAGSGGGGSPGTSVAGSGALAGSPALGGSAGPNDGPSLSPQRDAPPAEGDGRLPDLPETRVGESGTGWDLCSAGFTLSSNDCGACPAARGEQFLVVGRTSATEPSEPSEPAEPERPQAYFYFHPATTASALWLDVAWLAGARSARLSLWETDTVCSSQGAPKVYELSPLLTGPSGAWTTACVPLTDLGPFAGLGFRIATSGRLGLDALRFGPPCPEP